jgi:hypothetical protein
LLSFCSLDVARVVAEVSVLPLVVTLSLDLLVAVHAVQVRGIASCSQENCPFMCDYFLVPFSWRKWEFGGLAWHPLFLRFLASYNHKNGNGNFSTFNFYRGLYNI